MNFQQTTEQLEKRPSMYSTFYDFQNLCSFISGLNIGEEGLPLKGFREWLLLQLSISSPRTWPLLVLQIAFKSDTFSNEWKTDKASQECAKACLFEQLRLFHDAKSEKGLDWIMDEHHQLELKTRKFVRDQELKS